MISSLLLVGCGKMGGAMLEGWLAGNIAENICILEPHDLPDPLRAQKKLTHIKNPSEFKGLNKKFDVIVLAVKPQIMDSVCTPLRDALSPDTLILSIAAGKPLSSYESYFSATQPIIRSMPNTPAAIAKGAIVAIPNEAARQHTQKAAQLLEIAGELHWIEDESLMDAVTALSGSGPAYVFHLIEALAKAGANIGLEENMAENLARQTVIGAAALAEQNPDTPAETLRTNVTSPGGTTEAALNVLMNGEFQDILTRALSAAQKRGKELSA